ncbi:MAG: amino acid ABC transporter substrate-binding protein [Oscillospiraceae bacterium]|nr:amino acid ABC transporter substrate-binding protein [Oscillospiraceae bacterium]
MKNIKNVIVLLLVAAMCFGVLGGCGDKKAASETDTPAVGESAPAERTTLTVGFDASFPPYGYTDDSGEYVGFDLDLAAEVCKRNGWELIKKPIDWDSKDMELESGTIDCIWNGFTINGRENDYEWTEAYVDNSQVIVVAADSGIADLAGLAGKTVLVQADSSALAALTDEENQTNLDLAATFAALTEVPDYLTAFMSLESGAADAVAMDIGVAKYQIAQNEGKYIMLDQTIASEQYGVGFKLGNKELRDQVQKTLNEMVEDGTFIEIATKWELQDAVCLGK